ncbi:Microtubule-associated protein, microtubule dynamics during spindle orientation, partial [Physocladia obscura]
MEEDDFSKLGLDEQLAHKNWKARVCGFNALVSKFKKDEATADIIEAMRKTMSAESNAAVLDSAMPAVLACTEFAKPSLASRYRSSILHIVLDKAIAHTRVSIRQKALDIVLMFIELENKADAVLEDLLPTLDHKNPKNVAALYGSKVVPPKPLLKTLAKLFDHKDGTVRTEAMNLAIELYKWLGPAIMPSLNDLKAVQLKDLNDQFEKIGTNTPRPTPERLVRSEMEKRAAVGYVPEEVASVNNTVGPVEPEVVDVFDLADPVNVLDKMPPKFYETLQATKWSERKEILEALLVIIKVPKLEDGRYGELINVLAKKINDTNIIVLTLAINCLECLANGLR